MSSTYIPYYDTLFKQKKVKENDTSFELIDPPDSQVTKPAQPEQEVNEPDEESKEDEEEKEEEKIVFGETDSIPLTPLQALASQAMKDSPVADDLIHYKSSVMSDQQIKISKFI